ncbi:dTMP kinase [Treponema phagedenis]|uniref:dTMP kinase n=1 Tax=Treponema phagedenis TaxID=162 RepID=UPI0001F63F2A|nr:dTMP kinase [Treponema phagedenis]EFW37530.1 dTMP kinase [Treponema phagedenis F0421]TYT77939.1 dTMP kinase [Treponema phagedenis]
MIETMNSIRNFIVFEGIDGTGTTSQLRLLRERFASIGKAEKVVFTQEPTDTEIGKLIRKALSKELSLEQKTIAQLFAADRTEHIYGNAGIIEHTANGKAVFSDRYFFSSLAYQGLSVGKSLAKKLNEDFPLPELLFFFDIPVQTSMSRIDKRGLQKEIYEKKDFQTAVRQEYLRIIEEYEKSAPEMQIIRIDAEKDIQEIHQKIWSFVENLPKL